MHGALLRKAIRIGREEGLSVLARKSFHHIYRNVGRDIRRYLSRWFPVEKQIKHPSIEFNMMCPRTPPDYSLGKDYPENKCHEPIVTGSIVKALNNIDDSTFWDVGAATGYYSVLSSKLTNSSQIHAFEGSKTDFLAKNNERYGNGDFNINKDFVGDRESETIVLDNYREKHGCPDIIKIDVDGAERDVLSGMTNLMENCTPILFLEVHLFNHNYSEFEEFIGGYFDNNYNFKICMNHREMNADWAELDSLNNLPKEDIEYRDFILLCYPRNHQDIV